MRRRRLGLNSCGGAHPWTPTRPRQYWCECSSFSVHCEMCTLVHVHHTARSCHRVASSLLLRSSLLHADLDDAGRADVVRAADVVRVGNRRRRRRHLLSQEAWATPAHEVCAAESPRDRRANLSASFLHQGQDGRCMLIWVYGNRGLCSSTPAAPVRVYPPARSSSAVRVPH